ncbi:uncharacterized protein BXZ73DRAFT_98128 [Epithele typhae]|uniref:uncharacterized protein n=1 Tax=Epithele typhae TaxID=378194 RepID=UPI00200785CA|nr:uncharacterized protein BXZ73DRAFT_98128 [Epithele typhae]KAH9941736.1 hypothetical protein BXZ73DRAFT_98128 [Epithele typhae]
MASTQRTVVLPLRCALYAVAAAALLFVRLLPARGVVASSACACGGHDERRTYSYVGDDFPAQAPISLPATTHVQTSGEPAHALDADAEWGALFPSTDGFVTLRPPPAASSALSNTTATGRTFLVSAVHELHCLDVFRVAIADAARPGARAHVAHCLRYMLQLVRCRADATLEADEPGVRDGRWAHAASGVGAVHVCRDWRALWAWVEAHPPDEIEGEVVEGAGGRETFQGD